MIALIPVAAAAPLPDAGSLVLVLAAASAGAILSRLHSRIILPTVVLEIVLGILIGPEGLGLAEIDSTSTSSPTSVSCSCSSSPGSS